MSRLLFKFNHHIYKYFKIVWIILTVVVLLVSISINKNINLNYSYNDMSSLASRLTDNLDGFIEDLFQEVYTLPVYGKKFTNCKSVIQPYLDRITLNNPNISGVSIIDNKSKVVCSTLPENEALFLSSNYKRTINGPLLIPFFDQPVYLLQQRLGNYHISIIVLASVLQQVLHAPKEQSSSIALHNTHIGKNLIRIEKNKNDQWIFSKDIQAITPQNTSLMFAIDKLQSIDGMIVVVFENHKTMLYNLWFREILSGILVLLGSYFLYLVLSSALTRRFSLHGMLKLALRNHEFYPEYQPIFDSKNNRIDGVEVLIRWQDHNENIIMPDFFISEAEASGLIIPMTVQIVEIAFKECKELIDLHKYFHLSFNISALHFKDPIFFSEFESLVHKYAIPSKQILFELTERDLLDKNDSIFFDKMLKLRQEGYSLAVDDYGTGHASISYLQHFPFNYLKIDKIFIQAIGTKAITESLNDSIIHIAKSLDLAIIAEGVETTEQVDYLTANGVHYLQGWYYSKAISIFDLKKLIQGAP